MRISIKVSVILFVVFVIQTISGCCDCKNYDTEIGFKYQQVKLFNLENCRTVPKITLSDTLYRQALALQVMVNGNNGYALSKNSSPLGFGFSGAYAFHCDCPPTYITDNPIKDFSVITLFSLNGKPAFTDITDIFLYSRAEDVAQNLYLSKSKILPFLQNTKNDFDGMVFQLFVNESVENDSVRFAVNILLSDNTVLSDTSHVIYLK